MNRLTVIAMFAAAVAFTGCKKKDEGNKPATTEAKPTAGTPAAGTPAAGTPAAGTPAAGTPAAGTPAAGTPAGDTPPMAGSAVVADPATVPAAGGPAPTDAEFEAMMGKLVGMMTALGDAADKSGGDCGKLAESIEKVMTDSTDVIAQAKTLKGNPEMEKKGEAWMMAHQTEMMAPMGKMMGVSQKCATDAKFIAAMEKLKNVMN